jgi:hypothetical protein
LLLLLLLLRLNVALRPLLGLLRLSGSLASPGPLLAGAASVPLFLLTLRPPASTDALLELLHLLQHEALRLRVLLRANLVVAAIGAAPPTFGIGLPASRTDNAPGQRHRARIVHFGSRRKRGRKPPKNVAGAARARGRLDPRRMLG